MRYIRKNIAADGSEYLETLFGWGWTPGIASSEAKTNRDNYEMWIERLVGYINTPAVGYWILGRIVSSGHQLVIKPWMPQEGADRAVDNQAHNPYPVPSDWADAGRKGEVVRREEHEMSTGRVQYDDTIGTGRGTDVVLRFTPWFLPAVGYWGSKPGYAPDEVLLHEMIHSMNFMTHQAGTWIGAPRGYKDLEEFSAVLFTNLYSSQTGRQLRKDHDRHAKLPDELADSQAFFDAFKEPVMQVRERHRDLANIYAGWDANFLKFNPFRIAATAAP